MKSLVLLTAGALLAFPLLAGAQTSTNAAPPGPPPEGGEHHGPGMGMGFLTPEQKAEYMKDRDAAMASDPTLASQIQSLHEQMKTAHDSGEPPSQDLMEQMKTAQDQLDQIMIKNDAAVAPIIDEIKKHHHHHGPGEHGPGGPGGPGGSSSTGSGGAPPAPPDGGN